MKHGKRHANNATHSLPLAGCLEDDVQAGVETVAQASASNQRSFAALRPIEPVADTPRSPNALASTQRSPHRDVPPKKKPAYAGLFNRRDIVQSIVVTTTAR